MHKAANNTDSVTHKVSTASTVQLKKLAGQHGVNHGHERFYR